MTVGEKMFRPLPRSCAEQPEARVKVVQKPRPTSKNLPTGTKTGTEFGRHAVSGLIRRYLGSTCKRRTIVAAPFVTAGEAPQIGERNDLAELLVQGTQGSEFRCERGEKLSLQVVKVRRQLSHERPTPQPPFRSNKATNIPNKLRF